MNVRGYYITRTLKIILRLISLDRATEQDLINMLSRELSNDGTYSILDHIAFDVKVMWNTDVIFKQV